MSSPADKARFARLQSGSAQPEIIQKLPPHPDDMKRRFPSLNEYEEKVEAWRVKTNIALRGGTS